MSGEETAPSTGDLTLRSHARDATIEVTVTGTLDMAAAFQFETRLDSLLGAGDVRAVQLDLAKVGLIDSAGLGALLSVHERAKEMGIDLTITPISDRVRRVLDVTGLTYIADG